MFLNYEIKHIYRRVHHAYKYSVRNNYKLNIIQSFLALIMFIPLYLPPKTFP